jgi:hypothetical protein
MILLVTALNKADDCAKALEEATKEPTSTASTLRAAVEKLQAQEFSAAVLDQLLLDSNPEEAETVVKHLGTAVPVYVNFAISGLDRLVGEVRGAVQRRKREIQTAKYEAEQCLRHELSEAVTALLLSCEMALQVPDLPAPAIAKMRNVHQLAGTMREKLGCG